MNRLPLQAQWMQRMRWLPWILGTEPEFAGEPRQIDYRIGHYQSFLDDLTERIRAEEISDGDFAGDRPFRAFNVAHEESWLIGLFKAWATVGDVLTFYQERIVNEGYLATAREEASVRELVRLIDYVRFPGVGSSSPLAFSIYDVKDMPDLPVTVTVPAGTAVMSIPPKAEMPQNWETTEEILARADWNAMRPIAPSVEIPATLAGSVDSLRLRGAETELESGALILTVGEVEGATLAGLHRLGAVESLEAEGTYPASTLVSWESVATSVDPGQVLQNPYVLAMGRNFDLFGHDAPEWSDLPDEVKLETEAMLGGVAVATSAGEWDSISTRLPLLDVSALVAGPDGSLFAGTENGIFRLAGSEMWNRSGRDLIGQEIVALASDGQSQLFAGTAKNGVLQSSDGESWQTLLGEAVRELPVPIGSQRLPRSGRLPSSPVRALLPEGNRLYAGTEHGVFVFESRQDTWEAINRGLPGYASKTGRAGLVVWSLLRTREGERLMAGTDKGVFVSASDGRRWSACNQGLPGYDSETGESKNTIFSLVAWWDERTETEFLFAGTDQGVFRSIDGGSTWEGFSAGLPETDFETSVSKTEIHSIAVMPDPITLSTALVAGTPAGLFRSHDLGVFWAADGDPLMTRPVTALTLSAEGRPAVAVPQEGFERTSWPGFRLRDGQIDLASPVTGVSAGDWLALYQDRKDRPPRTAVFRAREVSQVQRSDFTLSARVTRIRADRLLDGLEDFDLRTTSVLAHSSRLEPLVGRLPIVEPMNQAVIALDTTSGSITPFDRPRRVVVTGKRMRLRFNDDAERSLVTERDPKVLLPGEELEVLEPYDARDDAPSLRLRRSDGSVGWVDVDRAAIEWRPARAEDEEVAEPATAKWSGATSDSRRPALNLDPALGECLDPRTVKILANIANASQGSSVQVDPLGSGDSTQVNQRFKLKASPLTYLRAATAKGYSTTLEVRVNGVLWEEADSLALAGTADRVYMVRDDGDGIPEVIFGDGVMGSRLPTGEENVVATYRHGMWTEGVDSNKLKVLQSAPLGLKEVTNPLPVAAGERGETADDTRIAAPLSIRTLDRIVSFLDYEDFCRHYGGIDRAEATILATRRGPLLQVTVATMDGQPLERGDELHSKLIGAVKAARSDRKQISIDGCRRARFELEATVRHDADRRPAKIEPEIRSRLTQVFSYRRSRFGGRVSASELVRRIREVRGVRSVRLERFHRVGDKPKVEPYMAAAAASWDSKHESLAPAELLELRDPGGVALNMVAE
ncbi:MAG: hypothetical protein ACE5GX_02490 [Thermoanaerobaculia bacterium]